MEFRGDGFDVWVFRRNAGRIEYLLLRTSQQKADRWFGGGRFWQIPSDFVGDEPVLGAVRRELRRFELEPTDIWAAEHAYTIFNRRYESVVHLTVFAAEVGRAAEVQLGPEHSESAWVDADIAEQRVAFRGLKDGLHWVRQYVTEVQTPLPELHLTRVVD